MVAKLDSFLKVFAVPSNSVGISVPTGVQCPLTAEGDKVLASYIQSLREAGAPEAEIETVTAVARLGHFRRNSDGDNVRTHRRPFNPACQYLHGAIAYRETNICYRRAANCLKCFFGPIKELIEIPDRYENFPSEGRDTPIPQLPRMAVEIHCPRSDKDAMDILLYEAAAEHTPSPPLPKLSSIVQIAQLTCNELCQYLRFYAIGVSKDADRNTKLELLKKELGIDCVGTPEFNGETLTEDESRVAASYFALVGSQLTGHEAAVVGYTKVKSGGKNLPRDSKLDIKSPYEMFRQQRFAADRLDARYRNLLGPHFELGGRLVEVPDCYGNVPSSGRDVHVPAQVASRTPLHIPGVNRVIRYVVLADIPEHPIVDPLPALTGLIQVMSLTPHQVNQYLKFYCVAVPEHADRDRRLELLKEQLSIGHIGTAYIKRYFEVKLAEMPLAIRQSLEEVVGIDVAGLEAYMNMGKESFVKKEIFVKKEDEVKEEDFLKKETFVKEENFAMEEIFVKKEIVVKKEEDVKKVAKRKVAKKQITERIETAAGTSRKKRRRRRRTT